MGIQVSIMLLWWSCIFHGCVRKKAVFIQSNRSFRRPLPSKASHPHLQTIFLPIPLLNLVKQTSRDFFSLETPAKPMKWAKPEIIHKAKWRWILRQQNAYEWNLGWGCEPNLPRKQAGFLLTLFNEYLSTLHEGNHFSPLTIQQNQPV